MIWAYSVPPRSPAVKKPQLQGEIVRVLTSEDRIHRVALLFRGTMTVDARRHLLFPLAYSGKLLTPDDRLRDGFCGAAADYRWQRRIMLGELLQHVIIQARGDWLHHPSGAVAAGIGPETREQIRLILAGKDRESACATATPLRTMAARATCQQRAERVGQRAKSRQGNRCHRGIDILA